MRLTEKEQLPAAKMKGETTMLKPKINLLKWAMMAIVAVNLLGFAVEHAALAAEAEDTPAVHEKTVQMIPADLQKYYEGYWYFSKVGANPYANWTPPAPPWQFCFNTFYQGNSWQTSALAEYKKLVDQYAKAGLAKPDLIVSDSNTNVDVQLRNSTIWSGRVATSSSAFPLRRRLSARRYTTRTRRAFCL